MDFGKAFTSTFENMDVLSAIASTIAIILLGFIMRKRGIFTETFGKTLTKVVMTLALPALGYFGLRYLDLCN